MLAVGGVEALPQKSPVEVKDVEWPKTAIRSSNELIHKSDGMS